MRAPTNAAPPKTALLLELGAGGTSATGWPGGEAPGPAGVGEGGETGRDGGEGDGVFDEGAGDGVGEVVGVGVGGDISGAGVGVGEAVGEILGAGTGDWAMHEVMKRAKSKKILKPVEEAIYESWFSCFLQRDKKKENWFCWM